MTSNSNSSLRQMWSNALSELGRIKTNIVNNNNNNNNSINNSVMTDNNNSNSIKHVPSKGNLFRMSGEFNPVLGLDSLHKRLPQILYGCIETINSVNSFNTLHNANTNTNTNSINGLTPAELAELRNSNSCYSNVYIDADTLAVNTQAPNNCYNFDGNIGVSLQKYLDTLWRHNVITEESLVVAVVYLTRVIERSGMVLTHNNLPRLLATTVMLGSKFIDDVPFNNKSFALCAGVPTVAMNEDEVKILIILNFNMLVEADEFARTSDHLLRLLNGGNNNIALSAQAAELWVQSLFEKDWELVANTKMMMADDDNGDSNKMMIIDNSIASSSSSSSKNGNNISNGNNGNINSNDDDSTASSLKRKFSNFFSMSPK